MLPLKQRVRRAGENEGSSEGPCWWGDSGAAPSRSSGLRESQTFPMAFPFHVEEKLHEDVVHGSGGFSLTAEMCYLVFLIAPSVREGKTLSCNIDLVTVGNSLIFGIINNIFICSVIMSGLCLTAEPKKIISYQI